MRRNSPGAASAEAVEMMLAGNIDGHSIAGFLTEALTPPPPGSIVAKHWWRIEPQEVRHG